MSRRKRMMEDLDRDIREHIELEARENRERGMQPDEAYFRALRRFGNVARVREETYTVWYSEWLVHLLQDVRYGLRTLRRNPGFASVVICTLALAIGMNASVFSVVEAVLLRPLPYPEAKRLVFVSSYSDDYQSQRDNYVSRSDYSAWKDQAHTVEDIAAYGNQDLALTYRGVPSQERVASITGDFWKLTGAEAAIGRLSLFQSKDEPEGEGMRAVRAVSGGRRACYRTLARALCKAL
jgi:hypothetical protein